MGRAETPGRPGWSPARGRTACGRDGESIRRKREGQAKAPARRAPRWLDRTFPRVKIEARTHQARVFPALPDPSLPGRWSRSRASSAGSDPGSRPTGRCCLPRSPLNLAAASRGGARPPARRRRPAPEPGRRLRRRPGDRRLLRSRCAAGPAHPAVPLTLRRLRWRPNGIPVGRLLPVADSVVHRAFRFHIDAPSVQYVFIAVQRLRPAAVDGGPDRRPAGGSRIELGILRLARRVRPPCLATRLLVLGILACFVVSQVMHRIAYYRSDTRASPAPPPASRSMRRSFRGNHAARATPA